MYTPQEIQHIHLTDPQVRVIASQKRKKEKEKEIKGRGSEPARPYPNLGISIPKVKLTLSEVYYLHKSQRIDQGTHEN